MKKNFLLTILLIIVFMFTFLGCGGPGNQSSEDTLKIAIVNKGYGTKWLTQIVDSYKQKTGKNVVIDKTTSLVEWVTTSLLSGPRSNDVDLYFSISETSYYGLLNRGSTLVQGYDYILEDLSDIYDYVPEGYDDQTKFKDLLNSYNYEAATFKNGKQYTVPWAMGIEGIVYNKALFNQYGLTIPRTTDEFFEVMDDIKMLNNGNYVQAANGNNIYPFVYSGRESYLQIAYTVWWAQYEGLENFENFLKGQNSQGIYTADIFLDQRGMLEAYKVVHDIIYIGTDSSTSNGYVNENANGYTFTQAQVKFLEGEAFMMCTGDWLEREMESNFDVGELQIEFMPIPVISSIIDSENMPDDSISDDNTLREVIDYINGKKQQLPEGVTNEALEYVTAATKMYCTEGNHHVAFIPSYSNQIDEAKEFLKYFISKEGQSLAMQYSYGNMCPLNIDVTSFDYYDNLSTFQRSKFEIARDAIYVGRKYNTEMTYAGGLKIARGEFKMESSFGVDASSNSYKTPLEFLLEEHNHYRGQWSTMMEFAGVHN